MSIRFCSLASGSSGNGYLVSTPDSLVLIDAGCTIKNLNKGLEALGKSPEDVKAILITHEHSDHVGALFSIKKRLPRSIILAGEKTIEAIEERVDGILSDAVSFEKLYDGASRRFTIGDMEIETFDLSHDAEGPMGFTIQHRGEKIGIVTDTGIITEEIFNSVRDTTLLILEANHEENVLMMGSYPYALKLRILGERGHLSNEAAAELIAKIISEREDDRVPTIALAHLSKENNSPDLARATVVGILESKNYLEGKEYSLEVLPVRELWVY